MTETFGEIEPEAKHALSHRRRAFDLFEQTCLSDLAKIASNGTDDVAISLHAAAANLSTQEEFVQFVGQLRIHLKRDRKVWENVDLPRYLEALGAWTNDSTVADAEPKWRTFAKALLAASIKS